MVAARSCSCLSFAAIILAQVALRAAPPASYPEYPQGVPVFHLRHGNLRRRTGKRAKCIV